MGWLIFGARERSVLRDEDEFEELDVDDDDLDVDADAEVEVDTDDIDVDEAVDDDDEEDEEADPVASTDDDADGDQASLEELLAQRAALRREAGEPDEEGDILAFVADRDTIAERLTTRVDPIKEREEFVCKRCYLVKPRVQLADRERMLCRDCV